MSARTRLVTFSYGSLENYCESQGLPSLIKPNPTKPVKKPQIVSKELDRGALDGINWRDTRETQPSMPKPLTPPPRAIDQEPSIAPPSNKSQTNPEPPQVQPVEPPARPQPSVPSQPISPVNHANKPSSLSTHTVRPITIRGNPSQQMFQPTSQVTPPPRLSVENLEPIELRGTPKRRNPPSELTEAKDTLHRLAEEEIKELENKNRELTKKNNELKASHGKLGIAYVLLASELARLENGGVTNLEEKSTVTVPALNINSAQSNQPRNTPAFDETDRELKRLRDENEKLSKMIEESRGIIDDLKEMQEAQRAQNLGNSQKNSDTQSRLKELGRQEELETLRRDNALLRERLAEVGSLRNELENLRRKLQAYEESQRGGSEDELGMLRDENKELRRRLEEYKHKNQISNERLRDDNEKLLTALEKDKRIISNLDYEIKKIGIEKENLQDELRSQKERHQLDLDRLKAKLDKRESAKKDLEQVIKEFQRYKEEKEEGENKKAKKYDETIAQNKFLKEELESITNELEALRKLYLEQNKKMGQPTPKSSTVPHPMRRPSTSGSSRNSPKSDRQLPNSTNLPNHSKPHQDKHSVAMENHLLEKFLLGLELSRLHFAYLNCRCKQPCSEVCQLEASPNKESRYFFKGSEPRGSSPQVLKSPSANSAVYQGEVAILMRERDNLKHVLADYQKKLLEARRQLDAYRDQAKENRGNTHNIDLKGTQDTAGTSGPAGRTSTGLNARELELQIKVLMAENARLSNLLARQRAT